MEVARLTQHFAPRPLLKQYSLTKKKKITITRAKKNKSHWSKRDTSKAGRSTQMTSVRIALALSAAHSTTFLYSACSQWTPSCGLSIARPRYYGIHVANAMLNLAISTASVAIETYAAVLLDKQATTTTYFQFVRNVCEWILGRLALFECSWRR